MWIIFLAKNDILFAVNEKAPGSTYPESLPYSVPAERCKPGMREVLITHDFEGGNNGVCLDQFSLGIYIQLKSGDNPQPPAAVGPEGKDHFPVQDSKTFVGAERAGFFIKDLDSLTGRDQ